HVLARHVPGDPDGDRRGGAPRLRPVVRRDRRDELHLGERDHDPEVHLQQHASAAEPADRERRGGRGGPPDGDTGVLRAAARGSGRGRGGRDDDPGRGGRDGLLATVVRYRYWPTELGSCGPPGGPWLDGAPAPG